MRITFGGIRLKKLTDSLNAVDLFDVQMKNLRQWLIETKDRLTHPVVFQNVESKELQQHYKEQMVTFGKVCWCI